jgi:hypothetical protein
MRQGRPKNTSIDVNTVLTPLEVKVVGWAMNNHAFAWAIGLSMAIWAILFSAWMAGGGPLLFAVAVVVLVLLLGGTE